MILPSRHFGRRKAAPRRQSRLWLTLPFQCAPQRAAGNDSFELEGFLSSKTTRALVSFVLIPALLASACGGGTAKETNHGPVGVALAPQSLTVIGKTQLNAILDAADLPDLRWSAFGTYRIDVRKFYDAFNGSVPWMHESRPTSQAIAIVQLLKNASNEGLNPEDYDGPRWESRVNALQQSALPRGIGNGAIRRRSHSFGHAVYL